MEKNLLNIIKKGEGIHTEFKLANNGLPKNLFETVCAFLNREGGYIFLGVDDDKKIVGIPKEKISKLKKEFSNLCNNEQKINPTVYLTLNELIVNNKIILYVYVLVSKNIHMSNGKFYDRNEDGDYSFGLSSTLVDNTLYRKSNKSYETMLYPDLTMNDLRKDLIERARMMVKLKNKDHAWLKMSDEEMLRSAKLLQPDENGKECINLACLLIFGKDEAIYRKIPYLKVDALLRVRDEERYDDRDCIETNLLDTFDRLMNFMHKHLPDPFYLEGVYRTSLVDIIARELAVNLLIHRAYYDSGRISRLIIYHDKIYVENASKAKNSGCINLNKFTPEAKNPIIAAFFREIDLADQLGSGFRKLKKYVKIYSNSEPKFIEGDMFISEIPLNCFEHIKPKEEIIVRIDELTSRYDKIILDYCVTAKTGREIQEYIGIKNQRYFMKSILKPLIEKGNISMTIPDKPRSSKQMYITYKK